MKRGITVLHHPPYSPGQAPADYFSFPKVVKFFVKGLSYDGKEVTDAAVTQDVNLAPEKAFEWVFDYVK